MILPVILAGGYGERLWPLSRELQPKQFLALNSTNTLLQETLLRLPQDQDFLPALIICQEEHRFLVAEQLRQQQITTSGIILEPMAKNTALAISVAALWAKQHDMEVTLLILPADHVIKEQAQFQQAIFQAIEVANRGYLVTFGILPTYAETGYGYISSGSGIAETLGLQIVAFTEKPDINKAQELIKAKTTFWNSGMFMFKSEVFLAELTCYQPKLLTIAKQALELQSKDLDFTRLPAAPYALADNIAIDHAIMEKTKRAAVVPLSANWCDIGNWYALWQQIAKKDQDNNAINGDVIALDTKDCLINAGEQLVATIGVQNLIITATKDAVLVAKHDKVQRVKEIVKLLKTNNAIQAIQPCRVVRPWGWFEIISQGTRFQVKRLVLTCEQSISLQLHHHRSEHWIVVKGTAKITKDQEEFLLAENQSVYIPVGVKHRLANVGKISLEIIEVQVGSYLGEDDIVRFSA